MYEKHTRHIFPCIFPISQCFYIFLVSWVVKPLEKLLWFTWRADQALLSLTGCGVILTLTPLYLSGQQWAKSTLYLSRVSKNLLDRSNPRPYLKTSCDSLLHVSRWPAMKNACISKKCRIFSLMQNNQNQLIDYLNTTFRICRIMCLYLLSVIRSYKSDYNPI